jgi:hypothetical protein
MQHLNNSINQMHFWPIRQHESKQMHASIHACIIYSCIVCCQETPCYDCKTCKHTDHTAAQHKATKYTGICNKQLLYSKKTCTVNSTLHRNKCSHHTHHIVNGEQQQAWHIPSQNLSLILYCPRISFCNSGWLLSLSSWFDIEPNSMPW